MTYPSPRKLQLRRGNTAQISSYTGPIGEIVINTDTWALYIQDGTTAGGHIVSGGGGGSGTNYSNANVLSYLTSFNGNIIPSANTVYSLGSITNQWKSLYVSNNTIYINGLALTVDNSGNLSINGNAISTVAYVNTQVANVDLTNYALNANVTAANVGLKGYVDQANTIQSAQISAANIGMKGYVDSQSFYSNSKVATYLATGPINISNVTISDNYGSQWRFTDSELQLPSGNGAPYGLGPRISSGSGIQIYPSNDGDFMVQTYATGLGGSRQYTFTPSGNITLSDGGNIVSDYNIGIYSGTNVAIATTGGGTWLFSSTSSLTTPGSIYLPGGIGLEEDAGSLLTSAPNDIILSAGTNGGTDSVYIKTNQETQVWEFDDQGKLKLPGSVASLQYSSDILFIDSGSDKAVVVGDSGGMVYWTFNSLTGNLSFPDASQQATAWTGTVDYTNVTNAYSNVQVATYLASHTDQTFGGNVTIQGNLIVNGNVSYISVNNFQITDNIINLADLNPADSLDIGISGHRTVNGIIQHVGLVRDASANQWRLFSNVVPNPGTTVDFTNAVYDDLQLGNITSPTITAINDSITLANTIQSQQIAAANVGIIGYIDQGNTIQAAAIVAANVGIKGYIDQGNTIQAAAITAANVGMKGYVDFANTIMKAYVDGQIIAANANVSAGGTNYSNSNVASYLITNGYVNTNSAYGNGNVTSYLPTHTGNVGVNYLVGTTPNVSLTAGTYTSTFDIYGNVTLPNAYVSGNVVSSYFVGNGAFLTGLPAGFSNVQVAAYLNTNNYSPYSNVNVASYLSTATINTTGNITAQNLTGNISITGNVTGVLPNVTITAGAYVSTFDNQGNVTVPKLFTAGNIQTAGYLFGNGAFLTGIVTSGGSGTNYSNVNVQAYTETMGFKNYSNVNTASYLGVTQITVANIKLNPSGNIIFADGTTQTTAAVNNNYGNINVKAYTESMGFANFSNVNVKAYTETIGLTNYSNVNAKAYTESMAFTNYSNVNVKAYAESMGYTNYSNVNVAAYTSGLTNYSNVNTAAYLATATITTTGNITAAYLTGNISITGNVAGTSPNVTIVAGSSSWVFDNQGNLTFPNGADIIGAVTFTSNITAPYFIGNGSQLTGLPATYSNVQTAAYLNAAGYNLYSNVNVVAYLGATQITAANIKLGPSGNIVFADGTVQTTAGGGSYSNVQVATYLPTYSGNIANIRLGVAGVLTFADGTTMTSAAAGTYSNVQVATYLPTYSGAIQSSNVQTSTANIQSLLASTNNATGALRVMGGAGIRGNLNVGSLDIPGALHTIVGNVSVTGAGTEYFNIAGNVMAIQGSFGSINATGNILASSIVGTIATASQTGITAIGTLATLNVTGNATVGNLVGNEANTRIIANTYVTTFDIYGNVTFPGNVIAPYFIGDGSLLTGIVSGGGSSYGNSNVAQYLPTYSGNIANIRLGSSGVLTFADGTTQITAGGGSYSNVQVAQYLQVGNIANISVAGNVTATYFLGNGALLTGIASSYSNVQVATYLPTYTGNISGNLTGYSGNVYLAGNIVVGPTNYTALPTTVAQFTGNANTYTQINVQNLSSLTDATAEYVATANNGTDTTFFVDMGIANSNYDVNSPNNSLGTTIYPNDSYLYAQGNLATTTGGNLAIGTSTPNKSVKIFAGGINSANIVATVSNTGLAVTGNVTATGNITATGYIVTTGGYGNISMVDYITANNVVATANVTVQGIGITMPNRPAFRVNGTSLYAGAQSTANVNLKGVAISTQYNQGNYFDATTGKFTAPIAGIYEVLLNARVNSSFNGLAQLVVLKNGNNTSGNVVAFWETTSNTAGATHFGVSGTVVLATGDYLSANILSGNVTFDNNDNWSVTYLG